MTRPPGHASQHQRQDQQSHGLVDGEQRVLGFAPVQARHGQPKADRGHKARGNDPVKGDGDGAVARGFIEHAGSQ